MFLFVNQGVENRYFDVARDVYMYPQPHPHPREVFHVGYTGVVEHLVAHVRIVAELLHVDIVG